jgi:methyltransferase-like protein
VAQLRAARGGRLINLNHQVVSVGDLDRVLLRLADGTRDRAALVDGLVAEAAAGALTVNRGDEPVTDAAELRDVLAGALEPALERLARAALLVC